MTRYYPVDPLQLDDDEPWRWSCPRCTAVLPRHAVADHVAAHDEHPEAVIVWVLAAVAAVLVVVGAWLAIR